MSKESKNRKYKRTRMKGRWKKMKKREVRKESVRKKSKEEMNLHKHFNKQDLKTKEKRI